MNPIIDFINANRDRYLAELKTYLAIPERERALRAPRRRAPSGRVARGGDGFGRDSGGAARDDWTSDRPRRAAGRRRERADDPDLRPLRRTARRAAQPVDVAALRADAARRAHLRARRGRRQGAALPPPQSAPGTPRCSRPTAGEHHSADGRRGGGGQRESGDVHRQHSNRLRADAVVISDSAMFAPGLPSILSSLRGLAYFQIDVRGPKVDLHSGSYGGAVINPAMALARILATFHDADGHIAIAGFYDKVREWPAHVAADARAPLRRRRVPGGGGRSGTRR